MQVLPQGLAGRARAAAAAGREQGEGVARGHGDKALADWDISRDPPYFGIRIPDIPEEKYLYVWLDAPIGYLASLKNYFDSGKAKAKGETAPSSSSSKIRKPSRSISSARTSSTSIRCSGLRCCGSPSAVQGARPRLRARLHHRVGRQDVEVARHRHRPAALPQPRHEPEWLRYYIAAKLNANVEDLDFNPDDFLTRVNSDLVGKYINIASRCAPFLTRRFGGRLSETRADGRTRTILEHGNPIGEDYEAREFGKALKSVMALADLANQYVDQAKPWELAKSVPASASCTAYARARSTCSVC